MAGVLPSPGDDSTSGFGNNELDSEHRLWHRMLTCVALASERWAISVSHPYAVVLQSLPSHARRGGLPLRQRIVLIAGLACTLPFFRGDFLGIYLQQYTGSDASILLFNALVILMAFGLYAVRDVLPPIISRHRLAVVTPALVTTVLFAPLSVSFVIEPLVWLATPFAALTFCLLLAVWGEACLERARVDGVRAVCLDIAIAYALSYLVTPPFGSGVATTLLKVVMPSLSACMWLVWDSLAGHGRSLEGADAPSQAQLTNTAKMLLCSYAIILLVSSLSVGLFVGSGLNDQLFRFGTSVGLALLFIVAYLCVKRFDPRIVSVSAAIIVIFGGALLLVSPDAGLSMAGASLITAGRRFGWTLFWVLLVVLGFGSSENGRGGGLFCCVAPVAFAITRIPINILREVGFAETASHDTLYVVQVIVCIGLFASSFFLIWMEALHARSGGMAAQPNAAVVREDLRGAATDLLAGRFGLTEQETNVLFMLSQGHTIKRIAEERGVSVNTIRAQAKSLYRKTDCHAKQEVIDLVEKEMAGLSNCAVTDNRAC